MSNNDKLAGVPPAARAETRRIASAIVESVRADEPMAHGLSEARSMMGNPCFLRSQVEDLVFALAREVELLHQERERLRVLVLGACSIATTPLPEDRQRILAICREARNV